MCWFSFITNLTTKYQNAHGDEIDTKFLYYGYAFTHIQCSSPRVRSLQII